MGSNTIRRPLWGVVGFTLLLALVGPYLLLNTLLGKNRTIQRALLAGELPSPTPVPRHAPTEQATATLTATATATTTPSPTPMAPGSDFEGAYVSGVTWLEDGETMVRVVVPNGTAGEYRAEVTTNQPRDYTCLIPNSYEDRLYCIGPHITLGSMAIIRIYHSASAERLVFESEFLAFEVLPTPTAAQTSDPGDNLSVSGNGTPTLSPTPSASPSGTLTLIPLGSQTATSESSPSITPMGTISGSTSTPIATSGSGTSTPLPSQTPLAPSSTSAPTAEPTKECKGPNHPKFPCTETPGPAPTDPPTTAPTDVPTQVPEPTQEPESTQEPEPSQEPSPVP